MQGRFTKTSAGQTEIQRRTHDLPRPVRNLLLVINDSQPINYWLDSVRGISESDIDLLLAQGLIEPVAGAEVARHLAHATPDSDWTRAKQLINDTGYVALYDVLTAQGRQHLSLMKGYRFVLEVEKCDCAATLRTLAHRFLEQLRQEQGMDAVRQFILALQRA